MISQAGAMGAGKKDDDTKARPTSRGTAGSGDREVRLWRMRHGLGTAWCNFFDVNMLTRRNLSVW